ncbi:glycosyltransferase family 22 protein [Mycena belliarum]|uniref:Mannosyltransferase n=1 Tax=Mycena belliarum TaxID=1033014 RepID=A0AAD6U657_9AGAR|nr:glycosyltransferase family 22 protein [Mycena belliae]
MTPGFVVCTALSIRILIALLTWTVFQPDEYWQALEPAHALVFGYGHLTWEWLSPRPIRSIIYPGLNVPIYWLLKVTRLDTLGIFGDWLVIGCPRILHGSLAALTDIFLCSFTRKTIGERYVATAFLVSLTSLFHVLSLSRSLSNSFETSLTTIALSYYPWTRGPEGAPIDRSKVRKAICYAALACAIRPTNAIIWVYLIGFLLWRSSRRSLFAIIQDCAIASVAALSVIFALDSLYYGSPTFTPLNFLATNLSNVSLFYGGNAWHYYLSQAVPVMCTTSLPFVLREIWLISRGRESAALGTMLGCVAWTISVYSLAGHKEWRFIHPLLPMLHIFAAKALHDLSASNHKNRINHPSKRSIPLQRRFLITLLISLPISCYIALLYCSAPIEVMAFLRNLPRGELGNGGVGFLMPCHSTPGQAYLHRPELAAGRLWALGCEPPLQNQDPSTYRDQTKVFFQSPYRYLEERFPSTVDPAFPLSPFPTSVPGAIESSAAEAGEYPWVHTWPQYLVLFGALLEEEGVQKLLEQRRYKEVWSAGRAWEGDSDERKGGVRVWKYFGTS